MRNRCNSPNGRDYVNYGARGIHVCRRWDSFENFVFDMEPSYQPGLRIERRNNDRGYTPSNCKWATAHEQMLNTRRTHFIDTPWGSLPITVAAKHAGLRRDTLKARVYAGIPYEYLFVAVRGHRRRYGI